MLNMAYCRVQAIFQKTENPENPRKIKGLRAFLPKRLYRYYTAKKRKSKAI